MCWTGEIQNQNQNQNQNHKGAPVIHIESPECAAQGQSTNCETRDIIGILSKVIKYMRLWQYLQHLEWSHGYSIPTSPFSRLKMPPRPQFDQPQRSFLAMEFHKRRGTRDFVPGLLADFAVLFLGATSQRAISDMHKIFLRWASSTMWTRQGVTLKTSTSDQNINSNTR